MFDGEDYLQLRFSDTEKQERKKLWGVLCRHFFQQFVSRQDTVLDIGAGGCEFINKIKCRKKYALDVNKTTGQQAQEDIIVLSGSATRTKELLQGEKVDVVFLSNFLEHMQSRQEIKQVLEQVRDVLKPKGKLLLLQPNIKYCYKEYWDFFDHIVPLSHKSLQEVLFSLKFRIIMLKPKFLPYTTKSKIPRHPLLVKIYLKISLLQFLFGKQLFICAERD
jgi:predicted SAM-dependent methyltransferase